MIKTDRDNSSSGITACNEIPFILIASNSRKNTDAKINNHLNNLVYRLLKTTFPRISEPTNITSQKRTILVFKY
jgi:hypothetical protein